MASSRLALACLLCLAPALARADPKADAKAHYEKGSVAFDLHRYDEAAAEYEAAYEAKPDPALLFNLAQALRLAGKLDRAIGTYQRYLQRMPQAKNRAEVEARIAEMKAVQEKAAADKAAADKAAADKAVADKAAAEKAEAERAETQRREARRNESAGALKKARTMKWAGLGTGLGGILVGAIGLGVYGGGVAAFNQINSPTPGVAFDPAVEQRMNTLRPTGVALFSVGLAAAAAGFAVFGVGFVREKNLHKRDSSVSYVPNGATFVAREILP